MSLDVAAISGKRQWLKSCGSPARSLLSRRCLKQSDQIGRFIGLWATYQRLVETISLAKSTTFLGNFCKGVKIFNFLAKSFLGNFYRHMANFYWSHWLLLKCHHRASHDCVKTNFVQFSFVKTRVNLK